MKINCTADEFAAALKAGGHTEYQRKPGVPSKRVPDDLIPLPMIERGLIVYYQGAKCRIVDRLSANGCDIVETGRNVEHWVHLNELQISAAHWEEKKPGWWK
jgi:hypothetical protein